MSENTAFERCYALLEILNRHGLKEVVISPGSRSAPLTLAAARHPQIRTTVVTDERSAAFIALGIAQAKGEKTALICTSGSALLNYFPAVAEAFFREVPLLLLTADRPEEWVDRLDGQTIRQENAFGKHIKGYFRVTTQDKHPDAVQFSEYQTNKAALLSEEAPKGPVHLNFPFREPFYPDDQAEFSGFESRSPKPQTFLKLDTEKVLSAESKAFLEEMWNAAEKVLIVPGQAEKSDELSELCTGLNTEKNTVTAADVISNLRTAENSVLQHDIFLAHVRKDQSLCEELKPDLLITFGQSVISKQLKLFLRENPPKRHLHISESGDIPDTFQSLTDFIRLPTKTVLRAFLDFPSGKKPAYADRFTSVSVKAAHIHQGAMRGSSINEFKAIDAILNFIAKQKGNYVLHLANSMAVRYANFCPLRLENTEVWANRGTSGIDGSVSTAVGHAFAKPDKQHILITGDTAFFYDSNAFRNMLDIKNLKIVLLNNGGGGIFEMIPGPVRQPECTEFFVTPHSENVRAYAKNNNLTFFELKNSEDIQRVFNDFFNAENASLLEIVTSREENRNFLQLYKQLFSTIF